MDRLKAQLTAKAGPFPVWVWAAIVLGLLVGYWYFTRSGPFGQATAPDQTSSGQPNPGLGGDLSSLLGGGAGGGLGDLAQRTTGTTANNGLPVLYDPGSTPATVDRGSASAPVMSAGKGTIQTAAGPVIAYSAPVNRTLNNYNPAYVAAGPVAGGGTILSQIRSIVSGGRYGIASSTPSAPQYTRGFNPVAPRSTGTLAYG